jgi:hypothetical protein
MSEAMLQTIVEQESVALFVESFPTVDFFGSGESPITSSVFYTGEQCLAQQEEEREPSAKSMPPITRALKMVSRQRIGT